MNITVSTSVAQHHTHPPQPSTLPARRVSLVDRLALHLGVALIKWSRRSSRTVQSYRQLNERYVREREAERLWRLTVPPR